MRINYNFKYVILVFSTLIAVYIFAFFEYDSDDDAYSYLKISVRENVAGPPKEFKISTHSIRESPLYFEIEKLMNVFEANINEENESYIIPDSAALYFELHSQNKTKKFSISKIVILDEDLNENTDIKKLSYLAKECLDLIEYEFNISWEILFQERRFIWETPRRGTRSRTETR